MQRGHCCSRQRPPCSPGQQSNPARPPFSTRNCRRRRCCCTCARLPAESLCLAAAATPVGRWSGRASSAPRPPALAARPPPSLSWHSSARFAQSPPSVGGGRKRRRRRSRTSLCSWFAASAALPPPPTGAQQVPSPVAAGPEAPATGARGTHAGGPAHESAQRWPPPTLETSPGINYSPDLCADPQRVAPFAALPSNARGGPSKSQS